jgi:hypothetical protein
MDYSEFESQIICPYIHSTRFYGTFFLETQLPIMFAPGHPSIDELLRETNYNSIDYPQTPERMLPTPSRCLSEAFSKNSAPPKSFWDSIPKAFHEFEDVFSKESFDDLPERKPWDHAIELELGAKASSTKVYPLSPNEQEQLDAFIEENLVSGRIHPSKSPMAAPVFFIKKKDGSLRLVQDYQTPNSKTIKNVYLLPLISGLINRLRGAHYFTKLDVCWGYNNVRIKEGDKWKAAFLTNWGLFQPLVMFFGLTNSPATFQTMMNNISRT